MPDQVVELVRRAAELSENVLPVYGSERTAKSQRSLARQRCGMRYDGQAARRPGGQAARRPGGQAARRLAEE